MNTKKDLLLFEIDGFVFDAASLTVRESAAGAKYGLRQNVDLVMG